MKTEMKHTPTPWTYGIRGAYVQVRSKPNDRLIYNEEYSDATKEKELINAAFIVRAVNAYEELLGLVKAYVAEQDGDGIDDDLYRDCKKAIAKAEGR